MKKLKEFTYTNTAKDLLDRLYSAQKNIVEHVLHEVIFIKDHAKKVGIALKKNDIEEILNAADSISLYYNNIMLDSDIKIDELEHIKTGEPVQCTCDSWINLLKGKQDYLVFNRYKHNTNGNPEYIGQYIVKFDLKKLKKKAKRCKNG
jgi:hypothetical protein